MSTLDSSSIQHLKEISHFCKEDKGQNEKAMDAWKKWDYKHLLSLKMFFCFCVFLPQSPFSGIKLKYNFNHIHV